MAALSDPNQSYGTATYFQTISDLTNRHYRFKSLIAPYDVFFDLAGYDLSVGQPVRKITRVDLYFHDGWYGNIVPHLQKIFGEISTINRSSDFCRKCRGHSD